MYKFIALLALVACVMAAPKPGYLTSPVVAVAHSVPLATSYSNSYQVALNNQILATANSLPAYAAYAAHAAPVAYAAAPAAHLTYAAQAAPLAYTAHGTHLAYAAAPVFKYY